MTTLPQNHRRVQLIFPVALASVLVIGALRFFLDNLRYSDQHQFLWLSHLAEGRRPRLPIVVSEKEVIEDGCNVFDGKWIWDNTSYPLYKEESCPFLVKQVTCLRNARPDSFYQNWRWQPHGCNLPRFDALKLLEMLRDKRMMFIGDSIQRGMFESMVCLVQSAVTNGKKTLERIPPRKVFTIEEFNASIEYYWAPFIVESISDHATNHTVRKRMVRLDSIAKHAKQWEEVDILVFESYVWWMYRPQINATYGSPDDVREYNVTAAYRLAMETSVFGERKGKLLTKEQRSNPKEFADCIHWCLPGVPDTSKIFNFCHFKSRIHKVIPFIQGTEEPIVVLLTSFPYFSQSQCSNSRKGEKESISWLKCFVYYFYFSTTKRDLLRTSKQTWFLTKKGSMQVQPCLLLTKKRDT